MSSRGSEYPGNKSSPPSLSLNMMTTVGFMLGVYEVESYCQIHPAKKHWSNGVCELCLQKAVTGEYRPLHQILHKKPIEACRHGSALQPVDIATGVCALCERDDARRKINNVITPPTLSKEEAKTLKQDISALLKSALHKVDSTSPPMPCPNHGTGIRADCSRCQEYFSYLDTPTPNGQKPRSTLWPKRFSKKVVDESEAVKAFLASGIKPPKEYRERNTNKEFSKSAHAATMAFDAAYPEGTFSAYVEGEFVTSSPKKCPEHGNGIRMNCARCREYNRHLATAPKALQRGSTDRVCMQCHNVIPGDKCETCNAPKCIIHSSIRLGTDGECESCLLDAQMPENRIDAALSVLDAYMLTAPQSTETSCLATVAKLLRGGDE